MRIRLSFQMSSFPLGYRFGLLSVIKDIIREGSEAYYDEFFVKNKNKIKPYAFSAYFKDMKIEENKIFAKELHLTISSSKYDFIMFLINGSQKKKQFIYKDHLLELKRVEMLKIDDIKHSITAFRTLSPILIENKDGKPLSPDSPNYLCELEYASQNMVTELLQRPLQQPINILQSSLQKQVIKEHFHQTQDKPLYFTAFKGLIVLEAHKEDLQCLYDCGLGFRTNQGFGLLAREEVGG
ncbi:CRISPR-associated endoribonuclease Cas6 [Scopulibacillus cellulosilyticus]|uniref:CRISPR-associated endoribonuclease Cas6 n=1 Tax=Scopulibacillus cellulosilyticus TaxID=2665665 RepID=A0ABW2PZ93_9BACL